VIRQPNPVLEKGHPSLIAPRSARRSQSVTVHGAGSVVDTEELPYHASDPLAAIVRVLG